MREEVPATPPAVEERRASYDTDKPFAELVRPHFFAATEEGELVEVNGEPDLIVEVEGKAKIRLVSEGGHSFLTRWPWNRSSSVSTRCTRSTG